MEGQKVIKAAAASWARLLLANGQLSRPLAWTMFCGGHFVYEGRMGGFMYQRQALPRMSVAHALALNGPDDRLAKVYVSGDGCTQIYFDRARGGLIMDRKMLVIAVAHPGNELGIVSPGHLLSMIKAPGAMEGLRKEFIQA